MAPPDYAALSFVPPSASIEIAAATILCHAGGSAMAPPVLGVTHVGSCSLAGDPVVATQFVLRIAGDRVVDTKDLEPA